MMWASVLIDEAAALGVDRPALVRVVPIVAAGERRGADLRVADQPLAPRVLHRGPIAPGVLAKRALAVAVEHGRPGRFGRERGGRRHGVAPRTGTDRVALGVLLAHDGDLIQTHAELGEVDAGGLARPRQQDHVLQVEEPAQDVDVVRDAGEASEFDRALDPKVGPDQLDARPRAGRLVHPDSVRLRHRL